MNTDPITDPNDTSPQAPFGFRVVLSISEMMILTRAMEDRTAAARCFALNNLVDGRDRALADCKKTEARIAQLKAMEPQRIKPTQEKP